MKCTFCTKEITDPPYNDEGDHYHTNCHFLISRIQSYDIPILHKLNLLVKEALDQEQNKDGHSEINCC
jgi:hypothetical protein